MRYSLLLALVLAVAGCTTQTLIPAPDGGPPVDGGAPVDSGAPDVWHPPIPDAGERLDDVLIYAHSADTLYEFSAYTNTVRTIGEFRLADGSSAPAMNDLAVSSDETIVTVSDEQIWIVDRASVEVTEAARYRTSSDPWEERLFALTFLPPDESPSGREMLLGASNGGDYYRIDLDTDRRTWLGRYPDGWGTSGDMVSVEGLGTFVTLRRRDSGGDPIGADSVAQIQFAADGRSTVRIIGTPRDATGEYDSLFGLGYWGRRLYGFTSRGQLLEIDRETAATRLVTETTGARQFWGAGVTTKVPFLI